MHFMDFHSWVQLVLLEHHRNRIWLDSARDAKMNFLPQESLPSAREEKDPQRRF